MKKYINKYWLIGTGLLFTLLALTSDIEIALDLTALISLGLVYLFHVYKISNDLFYQSGKLWKRADKRHVIILALTLIVIFLIDGFNDGILIVLVLAALLVLVLHGLSFLTDVVSK